MVAYSPTPSSAPDPERGDQQRLQDQTLVLVQSKSAWVNRTWQIVAILLLLVLSLVAVFVVVWTWSAKGEAVVQPGQKEALLQTTPDKNDPHSTLRRISSKAKAAIHLEGIYDSTPSGLQWNSGQGQGFAQGGIELQHNQIIIPESGLYFVYSQASFRVSCQQAQHDDPSQPKTHPQNQPLGPDDESRKRTPLSHRVWRYSDSIVGEVSLMSAVRSACSGQQEQRSSEGDEHGWYNAIYLGAVFQLNKGDRLWTETNSLPELETEEGKTFFGLFALF